MSGFHRPSNATFANPQTGSGSPNTHKTPRVIGDIYLDTANGAIYIAEGLTTTSWYGFGGKIFGFDTTNPFSCQQSNFSSLVANDGGSTVSCGAGVVSLADAAGDSALIGAGNVQFTDVGGDFVQVNGGSANFTLSTGESVTLNGSSFTLSGGTQLVTDTTGTDEVNSFARTTTTFVSGTGKQILTTSDAVLYAPITASGTLTLAMGSTSATTSNIISAAAVTAGQELTVVVPKAYFVKFTLVTATLGTCVIIAR